MWKMTAARWYAAKDISEEEIEVPEIDSEKSSIEI